MNVSKNELLVILLGVLNSDVRCIARMADAYNKSNPIWDDGEWIYVKDTEAALKAFSRLYRNGQFSDFVRIDSLILDNDNLDSIISDEWLRERIMDCRNNLLQLYPE